jgi:hypothetical protein
MFERSIRLPAAARLALGVAFAASLILAVGCNSARKRDLQKNKSFYAKSGYRTSVVADRFAFVAPMKDERASFAREAAEAAAQAGEPQQEDAAASYIQWISDNVWSRTPAQMVDGILRDELEDSGVVAELADIASADSLVLRPSLLVFRAGQQPYTSGRCSIAECAIRLEVLGPASPDGSRPTLRNEIYAGRIQSPIAFMPPPLASTLGAALNRAMVQLLSDFDTSNVARSSVPLDLDREDGERVGVPVEPGK